MAARSPYLVEVNQPFHLSGEAERYEAGAFGECEKAQAACREVVDDFLGSRQSAAKSPDELYELYRAEGPEPFIVNRDGESGGPCSFSANSYAEARCRELFEGRRGGEPENEPDDPPVI